jgi:hypothetical protein
MPDPTYNLNGGFKPTMKRFADLDGDIPKRRCVWSAKPPVTATSFPSGIAFLPLCDVTFSHCCSGYGCRAKRLRLMPWGSASCVRLQLRQVLPHASDARVHQEDWCWLGSRSARKRRRPQPTSAPACDHRCSLRSNDGSLSPSDQISPRFRAARGDESPRARQPKTGTETEAL